MPDHNFKSSLQMLISGLKSRSYIKSEGVLRTAQYLGSLLPPIGTLGLLFPLWVHLFNAYLFRLSFFNLPQITSSSHWCQSAITLNACMVKAPFTLERFRAQRLRAWRKGAFSLVKASYLNMFTRVHFTLGLLNASIVYTLMDSMLQDYDKL